MENSQLKELGEHVAQALSKWHRQVAATEVTQAQRTARIALTRCENLLNHNSALDGETRNHIRILAVVFKALEDFASLQEIISRDGWMRWPKLIEQVWEHLCDCKERLDYAGNHRHPVIRNVLDQIHALEDVFTSEFGPGLYISPEIMAEREICTVCGKDHRACEHISGVAYGGIVCRRKPEGPSIRAIAIVDVPKDPRCRLWPWNATQDRQITAAVLTTFRVDDFLESDAKNETVQNSGKPNVPNPA